MTLITTLDEAAAFVDEYGLAVLFPAAGIDAPSLWEAVAGPGAVPFATGMDGAESLVWAWKDELPQAGLAWYGTYLYRRACFLAPELLVALYPGDGTDDDHASAELCREAHQIADALRAGPLTTAALREIIGNRSRYDKGMKELNRALLVTSGGVEPQRSGWPASLVDLTCRVFDVGGGLDRAYAARRFLTTVSAATARDLVRAYGWSLAVAREELAALAAAGDAVCDDGTVYRAV